MLIRQLTSRALIALLVAPAALGLAACGSEGDKSKGAATGEGATLTIYSGRDEKFVQPLLARFEQQTGAKVEVRYGESPELAQTILTEGDASPADLFFSQDAGELGALDKEQRLAKLPQSILDRVPAAFRAKDGTWVGITGRARVVAYNSKLLKETDLPPTIGGYIDPRWKGKIGWAPTNASFQAFITAMRVLEGDEATEKWLQGIQANDPKPYPKNSAIRDAIAKEEIEVGFVNHYYVAQAKAEEGSDYPVDVQYTEGDAGSLINVAGAGTLSSSDHKALAERFISFLLAPAQQEFFTDEFKEYALVAEVDSDPDLKPIKEIDAPKIDLNQLSDLKGTQELLQRAGVL